MMTRRWRWTQGRSPYLSRIVAIVFLVLLPTSSASSEAEAEVAAATTQLLSSPDTGFSPFLTNDSVTRIMQVECPMGCQCTDSSFVCVNGNVSSVGSISPTTLECILTGNNLTSLRTDTFVGLDRLRKLDLSDNGIVQLESHSLGGLPSLRELKLSDNKLRCVNWTLVMDVFAKNATQLTVLNMTRNSVDSVKSYAFSVLPTLALLDLSENSIVEMDDEAFDGLDSLLVLDLSDNFIVDVRPRIFDALRHLTDLSLRGNRIRTLDSMTFGGGVLQTLDLSFNRLVSGKSLATTSFDRLISLRLRGNNISELPVSFTRNLPELATLDLGSNPIVSLNESQFSPGRNLREILVDDMIELVVVMDDAFADLPNLHLVNLSANVHLKHVSHKAFQYCPNLAVLDLSNGGLETLHGRLISSLTGLKKLALANNRWRCDCGLHWLSSTNGVELMAPSETKCSQPAAAFNESLLDFAKFARADCSPAAIVHHSERVSFRLGSTALLECQVVGDPLSAIKWVTPRHEVLHWYPLNAAAADVIATAAAANLHSSFHDSTGVPVSQALFSRVQVLRNGNLFIGLVERSDAGSYLCLADNSLGAQSVKIAMSLDYDVIMHVKVVSILVGVATSIAFLLAALVARLVEMILNRFGWCCCRGTSLPPKAKHIKKMLESVEHYKKQQLDRLRDNYTMQVQRIKDNCNQQMERIRESYSQQTDRFKDIRDYGTQQLNCMRDQYCDQIKRVRDYGVQQMSRVRENYVFQRNRVRKFRAHQLFKLRENYKVQQMHLNKILENMNLESCRTVCARTDSIVFTSETMESAFVGIVHGPPMPLDGHRCSAPTSADDILMSPFSFEMFDFAAIDEAFPMDEIDEEDEDDDGGGGGSFVTPPQSPIGSTAALNDVTTTGSQPSSSSNDSFADFEELVTCIVIPKSDDGSTVDEPNTVIA